MTIFYPDVSHFNGGLHLQAGTPIVVAKCTQATSIADSAYSDFKSQAASISAVFMGYHWLNHGNLVAQAKWCHDHNGQTPLMIDAEDVAGNTGYNGPLTVSDIVGFTNAYRALGGNVSLLYLPHWYWQGHMGSPSLAACLSAELHLVASAYRSYSDSGWPTPYGGMTPEVWQYTDAQRYGSQTVDFNAYKGTIDQFKTMIGATIMGSGITIPASGGRNLETCISDIWNEEQNGHSGFVATDVSPRQKQLNHISTTVDGIATSLASVGSGGLTDTDRALIKGLTDAVNALNSRLATP